MEPSPGQRVARCGGVEGCRKWLRRAAEFRMSQASAWGCLLPQHARAAGSSVSGIPTRWKAAAPDGAVLVVSSRANCPSMTGAALRCCHWFAVQGEAGDRAEAAATAEGGA